MGEKNRKLKRTKMTNGKKACCLRPFVYNVCFLRLHSITRGKHKVETKRRSKEGGRRGRIKNSCLIKKKQLQRIKKTLVKLLSI